MQEKDKSKYQKIISWFLAFVVVFVPYWTLFTPSVWARFKESVKILADIAGAEEPEKFAFVGISPESGTEVFLADGSGNILQITSNSVEEGNPQYDGSSNKAAYQALIRGVWQIFLYDVETDTTQQLSYGGANNTDPQISNGQVVWQSWLDDNWEIFLYDGGTIQRLTDNDAPDIEPRVSNNVVVWSGYDSEQFGNPKTDYDPQGYEIHAFDNQKKEKTRLTHNKTADSHPSAEYPYIVWQTFDGEDDEIVLHNLGDGTTSLITDNAHADSLPKIKKGRIKWLEYTPDPVRKFPENLVVEDGKLKLKLRLVDVRAKIDPNNPPEWWHEPLKCPESSSVCAYVDDKFWSYANRCFVDKAGGAVVHTGECTGAESMADLEAALNPTPLPTVSLTPEPTPDLSLPASESFTPAPPPEGEPLLTESPAIEPSPSISQETSPSPVVSPSKEFEPTVTSSPAPIKPPPEFTEPGAVENTGTIEGDSLLIEDREPVKTPSSPEPQSKTTLPLIEDAEKPQVTDESAVLKTAEAINQAVTKAVESAVSLFGSDETGSATTPAPENESQGDLIPVTDEPQL